MLRLGRGLLAWRGKPARSALPPGCGLLRLVCVLPTLAMGALAFGSLVLFGRS